MNPALVTWIIMELTINYNPLIRPKFSAETVKQNKAPEFNNLCFTLLLLSKVSTQCKLAQQKVSSLLSELQCSRISSNHWRIYDHTVTSEQIHINQLVVKHLPQDYSNVSFTLILYVIGWGCRYIRVLFWCNSDVYCRDCFVSAWRDTETFKRTCTWTYIRATNI